MDLEELKEKFQENFQGAIPLIVVLVLALFALGQLGVINLRGVPLVGEFFPAPVVNIVTVGSLSDTFKGALESKEMRALNVRVYTLKPQSIENDPDLVVAYKPDIIILSAKTDSEKELGYQTRKALASAVKKGADLLIIKDAGTLFPGDKTVFGWSYGMGDVAPVFAPDKRENLSEEIVNGTIVVQDRFHPLFQGISDFDVSGLPIQIGITPKPPAKPLSYIETDYGKTYEVIVESNALFGKTMWFAFDPGDLIDSLQGEGGKAFLINLINYLKYGR